MSLRFDPFIWHDLSRLEVQAQHRDIYRKAIVLGHALEHLEGPFSWTAWDEDWQEPIASCGIQDGEAWAFLGCDLRRHMVPINRQVRKVLDAHVQTTGSPVRAKIDMNYVPAVRWARILGFRPHPDNEHNIWIYS